MYVCRKNMLIVEGFFLVFFLAAKKNGNMFPNTVTEFDL